MLSEKVMTVSFWMVAEYPNVKVDDIYRSEFEKVCKDKHKTGIYARRGINHNRKSHCCTGTHKTSTIYFVYMLY